MPVKDNRIHRQSRPDFQNSVDETRPVTIDDAANSWWKKFSGYRCWELKGPLAITYAQLGPKIHEELKQFGKESSSEVSVSPFMVGKTPKKAKPMIVISGDKESREAAKSLIEKSSIIKDSEFELWLLRYPPSGPIMPVAIQDNPIPETLPLNSTVYLDLTEPFRLIGMPIYISHSLQSVRRATANVIYNGKEYAYITAAHAFVETRVSYPISEVDDEDFEMPFHSDSEDGSLDDEVLSQYSETSPEDSEDFSPALFHPPRSRSSSRPISRTGSSSSSETPTNESQLLGDLETPKHVGPDPITYSPKQCRILGKVLKISLSRDFAVISVTNTLVRNYLRRIENVRKDRDLNIQVTMARHAQVIAWTSHGAVPGHLAELPLYLSLPNISLAAVVYKFTYSDETHDGIRMGDCGSLVTSGQHTELYGHVVARSENSKVAYMVVAEDIAPDIKDSGDWSYSYLDDIAYQTGEDVIGLMPLWWAAQNGHERVVQELLGTGGIDINSRNSFKQTPLLLAAQYGYQSVVRLLLETGKVNVDSKDEAGQTPLAWAAMRGQDEVVKLLLEAGQLDVNSKDKAKLTPLLRAANHGHESVVKLLLETDKIDVDVKDYNKWTSLSWAAWQGHAAVVKLLLETGTVDTDSKDEYGWTPLSRAAWQGHEAVVKLLLETGKVDVNSKDSSYGQTPLSWAAEKGHKAVIRLLLGTGKVDPDLQDLTGRTPLSWATENGHKAVIRLLLGTGKVNPDLQDLTGRTPLSWAAENGDRTVVRLLLGIGKVDPDLEDLTGRTPLSWAAQNGHKAVIRLLLATGKVNADSKDKTGRTPLSWAIDNRHKVVVRLLLNTAKAGVSLVVRTKHAPLPWVRESGKDAVVRILRSY